MILNNCSPNKNEWELIPKEIALNQLKQEVGNCYMVSALEAISHIPYLLTYIFGITEKNTFTSYQKQYKLNFNQNNGTSEYYIVKNNFPVENGKLKFLKPLEKEAYAIIFEKVWAVIRGGYNKIEGGNSFEVFKKVLGKSSDFFLNENMKVFDIDNNSKTYRDKIFIENIKKSDIYWKNKISKMTNNNINSKNIYEKINNSFKNDGAIITVSINMISLNSTNNESGHEYSILGTYSKMNPFTGNNQDFVIIKNPWRSGDDIQKKINMEYIEKQIKGFDDIIAINKKHYETGVFYMPREYFEGWFRDITICFPNYEKYYPKANEALNLYKAISDYYNISSGICFFDTKYGNEMIKTDIISKDKFESLKKIIVPIKSDFTYVYGKQNLETIWSDGKDNIKDF